MNDWVKAVELIKEKFSTGGYQELREKIEHVQMALGTPGEVFAGTVYNINEVKKNIPAAYNLAKEEIDEVLRYAKELNYL